MRLQLEWLMGDSSPNLQKSPQKKELALHVCQTRKGKSSCRMYQFREAIFCSFPYFLLPLLTQASWRGGEVERKTKALFTKELLCENQRKVYGYEWWHSSLHPTCIIVMILRQNQTQCFFPLQENLFELKEGDVFGIFNNQVRNFD